MSERPPHALTSIDERRVESAFERIRDALNLAIQLELPQLEALIERFRIEVMLSRPSRDKRTVYRSIIDLLEGELERRYEAEGQHREHVREQVIAYFRRLVAGLDNKDG